MNETILRFLISENILVKLNVSIKKYYVIIIRQKYKVLYNDLVYTFLLQTITLNFF